MKLTTTKADIAAAIQAVQSVVEKKTTVPMLAHMMLSAKGDSVSVRGTNFDMEARASFSAEIEQEGVFLFPGQMLADIVRRSGDSLAVEVANNSATIKSGRSKFTVPVLLPDDFPESFPAKGVEFTLPPADLAQLIEETQFAAMDKGSPQVALTGIAMIGDGQHVTAVATNSHILARSRVESDVGFDLAILPIQASSLILAMCGRSRSHITIAVGGGQFRFTAGDEVLCVKALDGQYPDFNRVIPTQFSAYATVKPDELKRAVDRATIVADSKIRAVKFKLSDGELLVTGRGNYGENAEDVIEAEYEGSFEIAFNSRYVLGAVNALGLDRVELCLQTPDQPIVMRAKGDEDSLCVMMPMRG